MSFVGEDLVQSIISIRSLISGANITQLSAFRELGYENRGKYIFNPTLNSYGRPKSQVNV